MHFAHLNYSFVLTAAMRGLESGFPSRNRRAQHTHTTLYQQLLPHQTDYIRHQRNNNYIDHPIIMFHNPRPSYMAD